MSEGSSSSSRKLDVLEAINSLALEAFEEIRPSIEGPYACRPPSSTNSSLMSGTSDNTDQSLEEKHSEYKPSCNGDSSRGSSLASDQAPNGQRPPGWSSASTRRRQTRQKGQRYRASRSLAGRRARKMFLSNNHADLAMQLRTALLGNVYVHGSPPQVTIYPAGSTLVDNKVRLQFLLMMNVDQADSCDHKNSIMIIETSTAHT